MIKKITQISLFSTVLLSGLIGGTIVEAALTQEANSKSDVEFKAPGPTDPADPKDPENPDPKPIDPDPEIVPPVVYPGGPLRFNHIPSISFGVNDISSKTAEHFARLENVKDIETGTISPKASYLEIADLTGELKGWTVKVASDGIFKSEKGNVNASILFTNPAVRGLDGMDSQADKFPTATTEVLVGANSEAVELMKADQGKGYNKWQVRYGHSDTTIIGDDETARNPEIKLTVPEGQLILAGEKYVANLVWTLEQGL